MLWWKGRIKQERKEKNKESKYERRKIFLLQILLFKQCAKYFSLQEVQDMCSRALCRTYSWHAALLQQKLQELLCIGPTMLYVAVYTLYPT
jgi:hypothetical protein